MRRKMIFGVTVALGFACASAQKPRPLQANALATDGTPVVSNDPKKKVVCSYETLVGSHIRPRRAGTRMRRMPNGPKRS